jgi:hypothetical protein
VQRPDILDRRRETVEHAFGTIKQWMNQGAFLMLGLENVRAEFSLTALAYNLRRVLNIVAFPDLIAAFQAWKACLKPFCCSNPRRLGHLRLATGLSQT